MNNTPMINENKLSNNINMLAKIIFLTEKRSRRTGLFGFQVFKMCNSDTFFTMLRYTSFKLFYEIQYYCSRLSALD